MRIGFIGAGKVGFTFGRYIAEKRELVREKTDGALCLEVGGYFSASRQSAELAAEFTETSNCHKCQTLKIKDYGLHL